MKAILFTIAFVFGATAFADVDTVCQGGGASGADYRIAIVHTDGTVGSRSEKASINGLKTLSLFEGQSGDNLTFALQGASHVLVLDYNQMDATARLTGQGLDVQLFCSRN